MRRAHAVRDYLVAQGYPTRKIGVMGVGASQTAEGNKSQAGRGASRVAVR